MSPHERASLGSIPSFFHAAALFALTLPTTLAAPPSLLNARGDEFDNTSTSSLVIRDNGMMLSTKYYNDLPTKPDPSKPGNPGRPHPLSETYNPYCFDTKGGSTGVDKLQVLSTELWNTLGGDPTGTQFGNKMCGDENNWGCQKIFSPHYRPKRYNPAEFPSIWICGSSQQSVPCGDVFNTLRWLVTSCENGAVNNRIAGSAWVGAEPGDFHYWPGDRPYVLLLPDRD